MSQDPERQPSIAGRAPIRPLQSQESETSMNHQARQCTARRKDGRPCRSWARRDGDQALCARHSKARRREASHHEASHREARHHEARRRDAGQHPPQTEDGALVGFYGGAHPVEEAADLLYATQARNLKAELAVTRLAVRHVLLRLKQEPEPAEFAQLIALIFKGVRTIVEIMRVQHSFPSEEDERLQQSIFAAIDEIAPKTGLCL